MGAIKQIHQMVLYGVRIFSPVRGVIRDVRDRPLLQSSSTRRSVHTGITSITTYVGTKTMHTPDKLEGVRSDNRVRCQ